jgi:hypothetical protein
MMMNNKSDAIDQNENDFSFCFDARDDVYSKPIG